MFASYKTRC
uniref:Uncharacterized protein n=1 Tax=Vitis vinifera TaxID=29760 RepID=F6HUS5_VITVI